jgi:hypothetical protein
VQVGGDHGGELGAAGLRAAHGVEAVDGKAAGEVGGEGLESCAVGEEAVELEPLVGVVTGLHLEMAATAGEQGGELILHAEFFRR